MIIYSLVHAFIHSFRISFEVQHKGLTISMKGSGLDLQNNYLNRAAGAIRLGEEIIEVSLKTRTLVETILSEVEE